MSNELNVSIAPHREFMPADTDNQKLFLMLKLKPTKSIAATRPPTSFVFVIDTSGSMYEEVGGGKIKIDIVIESLLTLIRSGRLGEKDHIAIVQFDDKASQIIGLTSATKISELENAIAKLRKFSGGTCMGLGLDTALQSLSNQDMTVKRILLFTDGQTFDEDQCRAIAPKMSTNNIPITALGVGDFNEDLLTYLSDTTGGSLLYIVPGQAQGTQVSITDLPKKIIEEYSQAQQEVITNLALRVKTVQGVELNRIVRAYPTQSEFPLTQPPYPIGNAAANDQTILILELTMTSRPASRVRLAQIGLTYDIPGQNFRGEFPPQNLVVQFVTGEAGAVQVNQEVMDYLQQCNISNLVGQATKIADRDPQKAGELLETARRMTLRLGNDEMTASLNNAQEELRKTRKISDTTRKTVKIGAKGKTVKIGTDINDEFLE
ncbi:VWA domain-containing protein [Anabaena sp. FACHB-1237]|uniref:vWA domain-containing protein n=1 Tax=Anabaena sp. FACHB-1237 TaxID=2692769 RepID=UPI0016808780|nr:VWA domain-containing protein [Anabaena sp. FACHB-1237]MBD2138192.1 VWA domain-containing protein [Anabaena sp. FACHB-1237]